MKDSHISPNITAYQVADYLRHHAEFNEITQTGLDLSVLQPEESEMAQYQAVHQRLMKEIEDAEATDIWYDSSRVVWGTL